jgi:FkbM family methyltransferase
MLSKIQFQLLRVYVYIVVFIKWIINKPWKIVEGVILPFNLNIGFNTLRWILNGKYEDGEINIIKTKLQQNDIVLELGTGLGFISTFCAKKIGSQNVYTFEANPLNVIVAKKVFYKNKVSPNLTNAFLTNEHGTIKFSVDKKNRLASSIFSTESNFLEVEKILLNDTIAKIKPNFLIMDIEGAEYDIFKIINFQSINKIQFELHPSILSKEKCNEIFSLLNANNFLIEENISDERNFYFAKSITN